MVSSRVTSAPSLASASARACSMTACGAREQRWTHLLCGEPDLEAISSKAPSAAETEGLLARITALENRLARLTSDNAQLCEHVRVISDQLGIDLSGAAVDEAR